MTTTNKLNEYLAAFQTYLNEKESRFTSSKKAITASIFNAKDHFEIDEFLVELTNKNIKFSRATFYRTIKQLLDANLIQKVTNREGRTLYEKRLPNSQHDHIICSDCGKILEIEEPKISKQIQSYCNQNGFIPKYRSLHIYVECKEYKKSQTCERHL